MKTLKVVLVAALVSITMMSVAQSDDRVGSEFQSEFIQLSTVLQNADLCNAIFMQIDPRVFLTVDDHVGMMTASIKLNGKLYKIVGTFKEWNRFFYPLRSEKVIPGDRNNE
ncbi:MAG: hypothetical protein K9H16_13685 [Bacteroidales bacterium]|nr:hypothetical protein [Bacteroidales bacterium]